MALFCFVLHTPHTGPLLRRSWEDVSPSVGLLFALLLDSLAVQKLFSLMQSCLLVLAAISYTIGVLFRKSFPNSMSSSVLPILSSCRFNVCVSVFRSLIHFDLSLAYGERYGSSFNPLQR